MTCREDSWPWHEVFDLQFGSAEGVGQVDPNTVAEIDRIAENLPQELLAAKDEGNLPRFGKPVPQFASIESLLKEMLEGNPPDVARFQSNRMREVHETGIGPAIEESRPSLTPSCSSRTRATSSTPGPSALCPCRAPW